MTTSKDVFTKRKEGQLDEAYQLALHRMSAQDKGEWDDKALGWCLIDLIKRDVESGASSNLARYVEQLKAIEVSASDEVLTKQRQFALSLCNPSGQLANKARQLSKAGRHEDAVLIYRKLSKDQPLDINISTSFGWELYRVSKGLLEKEPINLTAIKQRLNEYLKLNGERPSRLHSCILQVASRFSGSDSFNMVAFCRIWGLEHLRTEDWARFVTEERKELPSLAEKVIQQASKEAAKRNDQGALKYIVPYLDKAISHHPDNVWLKLNKAKVLVALGRSDDALNFAIDVVRAKSNDYWGWELLGIISASTSVDLSLSCFCKALTCSSDDQFLSKVRIKLASLLVERGQYSEAKYEVNHVLIAKQKQGNKIPSAISMLVSSPWYGEASLPTSNDDFYRSHKALAEDLLVSQLPWIAANLGEVFVIPGKESRPRRKLYLESTPYPLEVVIPNHKLGIPNCVAGESIRVKGEWDAQHKFQLYAATQRSAISQWDLFTEIVGLVDHVNQQKAVIHFIIDRNINGVISFSKLDSEISPGDAIAVRLCKSDTMQGVRYRALTATRTDEEPSTTLKRHFHEEVRVSNNLGFTTSDIFIPPPLVSGIGICDGDFVRGVALLTFNKKRSEWGWKAVSVERVTD